MDLTAALLAAVSGYLSGSISFARVVARIFAPDQDLSRLRLSTLDGRAVVESDVISASTVRMYLGQRYGCLTSILDMAKAALPTLIFLLLRPDGPYYLIAAAMATVGHNWPVYHRFQGGRGLSPILGGMLVVDWLGVLVTNLVGFLLGAPLKNMLVVTGAGIVLMIPWLWIRNRDLWQTGYAVAMSVLFWSSMIPELREYARLRREGTLEDFVEADQLRVTGRQGSETVDTITLSKLLNRIAGLFQARNPKP